jgi:tetratricopeptide (TPR) repeat protein
MVFVLAKTQYYFSLFWLLLRLAINLFFFIITLVAHKFIKRKTLLKFLIVAIIALIILTLLVFQRKNTARVIYQQTEITNLQDDFLKKANYSHEELKTALAYYQELIEKDIKNPKLYLNLAYLYQALASFEETDKNKDLADQYLEKAQTLDPNNEIFIY